MKMKRTQIYITNQEHAQLKEEAAETGLTLSDIIRRIIDSYFELKSQGKSNNKIEI